MIAQGNGHFGKALISKSAVSMKLGGGAWHEEEYLDGNDFSDNRE